MARKHPLIEWSKETVRLLESYRQTVLLPLMRDRPKFESMSQDDQSHVGRLQSAIDEFVHDHTCRPDAPIEKLLVIFGDGVVEHEHRIKRLGELESMRTLVSYILNDRIKEE